MSNSNRTKKLFEYDKELVRKLERWRKIDYTMAYDVMEGYLSLPGSGDRKLSVGDGGKTDTLHTRSLPIQVRVRNVLV